MCGFAGYVTKVAQERGRDADLQFLAAMGNAIRHRGPDDEGVWTDEDAGVGLVHRRLSVIDLSSAGHQPMESACGRYVLIFNGEIYNHLELREMLTTQPRWRGHSDTETLLACTVEWGLEKTLKRAIGMFALVLWDRRERSLSLARDRMGEKPLYFGWQGQTFLFGSELKALRRHPHFEGKLDRRALPDILRFGYIAAPRSVYEGISKLEPGHILTLETGSWTLASEPYWSYLDTWILGLRDPLQSSDKEAIDLLENALLKAVSRQMIADVPLGAFLSGGIDSSLVVSLMQQVASRPVRTFTVGFNEPGYNEAEHAKAVAAHLGTEHTELYVQPEDAMRVIPRLPEIYDEPFADMAAVPNFLISELARQSVTVTLSGDAGDELFCGYTRYLQVARKWQQMQRWPNAARHTLGSLSRQGEHLLLRGSAFISQEFHNRLEALASLAAEDEPLAFYRRFISQWPRPEALLADRMEEGGVALQEMPNTSYEDLMMLQDATSYLPDCILTKVDRAAMAVSLETRVPLLDHNVVELSARVPLGMKLREGRGKWILRQVLDHHVPQHLIDRPKQGFSVPVGEWIRGPLRDWAESLLNEDSLEAGGVLNAPMVRKVWHDHLEGRWNWQDGLWHILMFQAWMEKDG